MPKIEKTDKEWKKELSKEQYGILRKKVTERPYSGALLHNDENGDYTCGACGNVIFKSDTKYDSTTPGLLGWPSFSDAIPGSVELHSDRSLMGMMERTEVTCARCDSHLGHVFDDPSSPTNQHFCINSLSLNFTPKK